MGGAQFYHARSSYKPLQLTMQLYNRFWTRREIEARVGRIEQVGGLERRLGTEGPEAGMEFIQLRTGAGLACRIIPSRGLDISLAEFAGAPLSWLAGPGEPHPAFYEPQGLGWLRSFCGGLLSTCGLTQAGAPGSDAGEALGLHGRVNNLPARQVVAEGNWHGDDYELRVAGVVEEVSVFGHHLRLRRELRARLGENTLHLHDVVENAGFKPAPHMLLYHCNFGFPLLTGDTLLRCPAGRVVPRDAAAIMDGHDRWPAAPDPDFAERVYYHEDVVTKAGWATATIEQPAFPVGSAHRPLAVRLSWKADTLPRFVQWKMPCAGTHVLGLEPANCLVVGRAAERAAGTLVTLAPGESRSYELRFEVVDL